MVKYRQDVHTASLILWAILCVAFAVFLFVQCGDAISPRLQLNEIAAGASLLLFGPVALILYVLRARSHWVSVEPALGIVISGKYLIPWDAIEKIERRRPVFRRSTGPTRARAPEFPRLEGLGGCALDGCVLSGSEIGVVILVFSVLGGALILFWLFLLVVVPLLVVPLLEVFAPFGDRIRIVTPDRVVALRDLRDADLFLSEVRDHVLVVEKP